MSQDPRFRTHRSHERDLGKKTTQIVDGMKAYDPGSGWTVVTD